jgi:uncharacterized membrane protein
MYPSGPLPRLLDGLSFGLLAAHLAILFARWPSLPSRIAIHFDLLGTPTAWGDRTMIWLIPAVAAMLSILLVFVRTRIVQLNTPRAKTPEAARRVDGIGRQLIALLNLAINGIFLALTIGVVRVALGQATGLGTEFLIGTIGVLAIVVGTHLIAMNQVARGD